MRYDIQEVNGRFKCQFCNTTYKNKPSVYGHIRTTHPLEFRDTRPKTSLQKLAMDFGDIFLMFENALRELEQLSKQESKLQNILAQLQGLTGLEIPHAEVQPTQAPPFGKKEKRGQYHKAPRKLSKQEKEQIRLLWNQSDKNKAVQLPKLASLYKTSPFHIDRILFAPFVKNQGVKRSQKAAS